MFSLLLPILKVLKTMNKSCKKNDFDKAKSKTFLKYNVKLFFRRWFFLNALKFLLKNKRSDVIINFSRIIFKFHKLCLRSGLGLNLGLWILKGRVTLPCAWFHQSLPIRLWANVNGLAAMLGPNFRWSFNYILFFLLK